ncbi:MAG: response regulator transcription factor [Rubrivivax sp.]|jgi:DNA-binding NarL/FixJ family response regulator|nr:response regulator transcription factor [Rubrivivax sp.]
MSITVFLVDDHATVREGLRFLLEAQTDIKVVGVASNGREAVHQVVQLQPDVVIMDIAMPELNGIEATLQIKSECPGSQVIILSMHSSNEQIFRALQAGALGYLLKETAGLEVAVAVRAVQAGRRYLSAEVSEKLIDEYMQQRALDEAKSPLTRLSPREREILQLVVEGQSSAEIAAALSLSQRSVETYRRRLMQKLGITNLPDLVKFAISHGLTRLE